MTLQSKTTVDWLRFRTKTEPLEALGALRPMFGTLGSSLRLKPLKTGLMGFQQGSQIVVDDLVLGRMDFGGESQRGWVRVDLPGSGCQWVSDWASADHLEDLPSSQIRRVDLALTTWNGEVTHDDVVMAHGRGRFTSRRPPALEQRLSSDPYAGRTCYIGKRTSDKFMRAYEKGWEMLSSLPVGIDKSKISQVMGHDPSGIYRCEVELKPVDTSIPWEVIERRDHYFAGSYPFCSDVLPGVESDFMQRRPEKMAQSSLGMALENVRIQYGPTLFTALASYGGDINAVWDKVVGRSHNQTLIEAGVLLVDHE